MFGRVSPKVDLRLGSRSPKGRAFITFVGLLGAYGDRQSAGRAPKPADFDGEPRRAKPPAPPSPPRGEPWGNNRCEKKNIKGKKNERVKMRALGRRPKGHEHARAESPSASKKRPGRAAKPAPASAAACRATHPSLPTAGACRFWELLRLASQFAKAAPRSRRITCVQRAAKADRVVLPRTAAGRSNAPPSAPQFCQAVRKKGTEAAPSGLRMRLARPAPCGVEIIRQ